MAAAHKGAEKILSYGDVLLRRSDIELLEGPHFLNDNLLEFYFAYLSSPSSSSALSNRHVLVGPSITFWLMHCPDAKELEPVIAPLNLPNKDVVIFAINNNEDLDMAEGGSHWSLLLYDRRHNSLEHLDSMNGLNRRHAQALVSIVKPFLGGQASSARLTEPDVPQQENGYDCGVYVMAFAQIIASLCQKNSSGKQDFVDVINKRVTVESVSKMRKSVIRLIESLA